MKTSGINNKFTITFKSLRTDKNQVATLKNGNLPIIENKKENILNALNNMALNAERTSIEFLLDVAKNLEYGQNGNSEFKDMIDESTEVTSPRENTDWAQILSDTIKSALNNSNEDVSDLEEEYKKLFTTKKPLTPTQKEILNLRQQFRTAVISENALRDTDSLSISAEILKNIDYFISSSEISLSQKSECLKKFIYFLSDEYKIDPQLIDKKNQVVAEMLNDMLIKTPEQDELTIKSVNQLYSGICAAISICRKAIAYEDKVRYMDIVFDELKDSPTMEIYDITDLNSNKKVEIPKIKINYNDALDKGYRILDASAHIWMNNAHASGDGSIQSETYVAFDKENYGIFDDSSWYEGLDPELSDEKNLLKSLIKEQEALDSVLAYRQKSRLASKQILIEKKKVAEFQSAINVKLIELFSSIFPEKTSEEIRKIISNLKNFYTGVKDDNELNISDKMPEDVKRKVVIDYLKELTPFDKKQEKLLEQEIGNILGYIKDYVSADNSIKKLQNFNTKTGQYTYYRKLYNLAAAHRLSIEADVNLKDGVVRFERLSGLPPKDRQVITYLRNLSNLVASSKSIRESFLRKNPSLKTAENLQKALFLDVLKIEKVFPDQLNLISKTLFGKDITEFIQSLFSDISYRIQQGEESLVEKTASSFNIKNDKTKVLNYINKWQEKLNNNPSDEDIQEAVRVLGFENRINMMKVFISSFFETLMKGITEEQYNELKQRFGGEEKISSTIDSQREKFINLVDSYNGILEKWEVPSSRELILQKLEKSQSILSREKLGQLQRKFDIISRKMLENESIKNMKERRRANQELYTFTNEEIDILNTIERSIQDMKKYCKLEYQSLNNFLFELLEDQYSKIGMLNGQFWVREEGSSGLASNEQVRIIEQMTGKPYHIQTNIEKAAKQIKEGDGSGIISYSVDDKSYAFHAQYVPFVSASPLFDSNSDEKGIQDVLWTDNSWGKAEREYFWKGRNGLEYTDYGRGYGWKNGFILSKDMKIGQSIQDIKDAVGIDSKDNDKFSVFLDMVLPGMPVNAYQKLYKMFSYILNMKQGENYYLNLEDFLKKGQQLDVNFLEGLDELAEKRIDIIKKRVETINSKEEYDKLSDDDYLKFIMELLSVYVEIDNPTLGDEILESSTIEDVRAYKENIIQEYIDEMSAIVSKSSNTIDTLVLGCSDDIVAVFEEMKSKFGVDFDKEKIADIIETIFYNEEKVEALNGSFSEFEKYLNTQIEEVAAHTFEDEEQRKFFTEKIKKIIAEKINNSLKINSLESSALVNSPLYKEFIAAIDKYLNPTSDEDLLTLIQGLQNADYETSNKFFEILTPEDLGLNFKHPYEYIKKLQLDDSTINKVFSDIIATNVISEQLKNIDGIRKSNIDESEEELSVNDLYRNLYVKLSDLDVQKYIRNFKAEAFAKYKVRQAFPEPVILADEEIAKNVIEVLSYIEEKVANIKSNDFIISVLDTYQSILEKYGNKPFFKALKNREDVSVNNESIEDINGFRQCLIDLKKLTANDSSLNMITNAVENLLSILTLQDGIIDGKNAGRYLYELMNIFIDWERSSINKEKFIQLKQKESEELKYNIKLMVNANISPEHRNDAFNKIYKIVSLLRRDSFDEDINYYKEDLINLFIQRHIVKNPTVLLKECVKLLRNGQSESNEYNILKKYLLEALIVAQQTRIQYKLVQNAHEGISSKTKELLPLFNVKLSDGTTEKMDSELGILYIIQQLKNESDNNTTLNLFLDQSGLSKLAVSAIINNFNLDKTIEIIDEAYIKIMQEIEDISALKNLADEFFVKSKIRYSNLDLALEQLITFVTRKSKDKNSEILKKYLEYLESVHMTEEIKRMSNSMILQLLESINEDAFAYVSADVNRQLDYIADISDIMQEKFDLLDVIKVIEGSEESNKKEEFSLKYINTMEYIKQKIFAIRDDLQQKGLLSKE